MTDLNLGIIGNGSYGALIDQRGRVVWACLPRFDSDPVFCRLLNGDGGDEGTGFFDIEIENFSHSEQHYVPHTSVLITKLYDTKGASVELTDFAPRFRQFGRVFRPTMMIRHIRPIDGTPRIRVRVRPTSDYGAEKPSTTSGSNHIRYITSGVTLRASTDLPVSFLLEERPFVLELPHTIVLGPDESLTNPIDDMSKDFYKKTVEYWSDWARYLSLPFEWQEAVVRAAITLKLCSFEETGALIAAMTTSIPEAADSQRNWDYRYCWLRDAYFVVHALNRLGATLTMENYLRYIINIVAGAENGELQPVYGITLESQLHERKVETLAGYRRMGPVRVGNAAFQQPQNDVYGSVVLASTQAFFDTRLSRQGDIRLFEELERAGHKAAKFYDQPDAGPWELRTRERVHTYSSVMCWAACDRLAKIANRLGLTSKAKAWRKQADDMHAVICKQAWNEKKKCFVESFGGSDVDASLLLLHELGFLAPTDPRFEQTVQAIEKELRKGDFLFRYTAPDDIGQPETSFSVCTFWYINALDAIGRKEEARKLFENMLACRNHVGLFSEDIDPKTGELWGNFPQTYSMVGLINSAMRLSKSWEEAF
ncbi:MAG: glycoside hydrolase family 15 protein [Alphaproteobacteria bacterium]|nr:glycoside hydrolase family 15 protein [Alphaproteobacteria bacterium]